MLMKLIMTAMYSQVIGFKVKVTFLGSIDD